ncbi:hypothetical protein FGO68_gene8716 [Halteria grandinella]|uniref:RRM domain-containing protein n=1 Tax=Halteria grandinella TaxID=5974 RepID=A0A8J8NRA1_HALGN|nr:hypothetical protein FGO68_gene8716 [Halteria grandinella]
MPSQVSSCSAEADKASVQAAFIPFGDIKSVEIVYDPETRQPKGFAHIEYEDSEDCEHAIFNMNESEFFGKVISVSYAKPMKKDTSKPVWQTEEYHRTVAQPPPERAGLVKI